MDGDDAVGFRGNLVLMGVAGCGKSTLGARIARDQGGSLIEGDDFHPAANVERMQHGIALTDADRAAWLAQLAAALARYPDGGAVLTCSALRRSYREQLRAASPGLRFVFLDIDRDTALQRVQRRSAGHFFPAALVASQFATLEPPDNEPGVLRLDATQPLAALADAVHAWLHAPTFASAALSRPAAHGVA